MLIHGSYLTSYNNNKSIREAYFYVLFYVLMFFFVMCNVYLFFFFCKHKQIVDLKHGRDHSGCFDKYRRVKLEAGELLVVEGGRNTGGRFKDIGFAFPLNRH